MLFVAMKIVGSKNNPLFNSGEDGCLPPFLSKLECLVGAREIHARNVNAANVDEFPGVASLAYRDDIHSFSQGWTVFPVRHLASGTKLSSNYFT